jgi:hypothetical protein
MLEGGVLTVPPVLSGVATELPPSYEGELLCAMAAPHSARVVATAAVIFDIEFIFILLVRLYNERLACSRWVWDWAATGLFSHRRKPKLLKRRFTALWGSADVGVGSTLQPGDARRHGRLAAAVRQRPCALRAAWPA